MLITIASRKVALTRILRTFIRRQLTERLERFTSAIVTANVELSDRNGRRGGGDKRCRIHLALASGGRVVQDDVRASLRLAISRAVDRAGNSLQRQLRLVPA